MWNAVLCSQRELRNFRVVVKLGQTVIAESDGCVEELSIGAEYSLGGEIVSIAGGAQILSVLVIAENDGVLALAEENLEWVAYNGGVMFPELLSVLSLPSCSSVDKLIEDAKQTANVSEQSLDYASNPAATVQNLSYLWSVFASCKFDEQGAEHMDIVDKLQDSLWISVLLFSSLVSKMGYLPFLVLTPSYAYLGVKMKADVFTSTPLSAIRNKLMVFECANTRGDIEPPRKCFSHSCGICAFLPHIWQTDYSFASNALRAWETIGGRAVFCIPSAPAIRESSTTDELETSDLIIGRPLSRMENWQLKLLDLSLRNPLLNVPRKGRNHLSLLQTDVSCLEDMLAAGNGFRVKSVPDLFLPLATQQEHDKHDALLLEQLEKCVSNMFSKKQLAVNMPIEQLEKTMMHLYNTTRREMEESGANSLYIACGFLKWQRETDNDKTYLAPLLLLPVSLTRSSAKAGFVMRGTDEESRMNLTLLELLKTEFGIRLPELEGDLPTDDSGVDVARIFNIVRAAISNMEGWALLEACSLGVFSFTKYLMWKDLTDREEFLLRNPIVRQIAAEQRSSFPVQVGFPEPSTLDNEVDADKVYTPMSSDSSQLSAVLAAARGKNFVLIGPPGTGKSQTITNMIAHCLGHGKTVLFVAEKAAALQVVHKRLSRIGLDAFCLEVHSNKANKKEVLAQFKSAVAAVSNGAVEDKWEQSSFSMASARYKLNLLPWALHHRQSDGTTLYSDVQNIEKFAHLPEFVPMDGDVLSCSEERRLAMENAAHKLSCHFALLEGLPEECVTSIRFSDYSLSREDQLAETLAAFSEAVVARENTYLQLMNQLGWDAESYRSRIQQLLPALQFVVTANGDDWSSLLPSLAKKTKRKLSTLKQHAVLYQQCRAALSLPYPDSVLDNPMLDTWLSETKMLYVSWFLPRFFGMMRMRKNLRLLAMSRETPDCLNDLSNLVAMRDARNAALAVKGLPSHLAKGIYYSSADEAAVHVAEQSLKPVASEDEANMASLLSPDSVLQQPGEPARDTLAAFAEQSEHCLLYRETVAALLSIELEDIPQGDSEVQDWCSTLISKRKHWRDIVIWNSCRESAEAAGFGSLADVLMQGMVSISDLEDAARVNFSRSRIRAAVEAEESLRNFSAVIHESDIKDFAEQDEQHMKLASAHVLSTLIKRASAITQYGTETALLQREFTKQRAHLSLRLLMSSMPNITRLLKPCMLMSPLSVAQYLDASTDLFDVVIFDEASQIPVWDAIGAIGRGRNAIIVGDPHQMPPTSFFSRARQMEDDYVQEQDMESILDECIACDIPSLGLEWHYRSKSESLISFSNSKYYDKKLVTFPAPNEHDCAVRYYYTAGIYEPGKAKRVNMKEAEALVHHVLEQLRTDGFRYTEATSIGIVTFNAQQQALIQELLDEARSADESLEPYFAESNPEAIFVKNLENVQGDERGVIYFSTTYGPDARGVVSMNFGPLNNSGGERRLNVAVTRARSFLYIFTSLKPEDIDLKRIRARGVADLRDFLDYARRGTAAFVRNNQGAGVVATDALAESIASSLTLLGWKCTHNVGVSDCKVDLAVLHPQRKGELLAGIMLDGATYAAANTARDRDVLRYSVLTSLGWRILRVWALDWWQDRERSLQKLHESLHLCLQMGPLKMPDMPELTILPMEYEAVASEPLPNKQEVTPQPLIGEPGEEYVPVSTLPDWKDMKTACLRELIKGIVTTEGPIKQTQLCNRIKEVASASVLVADVQSRISRTLKSLVRNGVLVAMPESSDVVLRLPTQPGVLPRACGNRSWSAVPDSELLAIADLVLANLKCIAGTEEHLRGIISYLRIPRLLRTIREHLSNLLLNRNA